MDDDHDHDQDPDASPSPAAGERCPCCCSSSSSVVPWRRPVKRKLGAEKGKESGEAGDDKAGPVARVEAEGECAALREAVASAQSAASALRAEVEEERLAAANAASEAMAMMLHLQREKAEVQMELGQFRRFADEKMALDATDIDQLRALLAQRARRLVRLRGEGEDLVAQSAAVEEEDLLLLEGEDGYVDGDGGYYPELRCNDGDYYYEDGQEEEDAVAQRFSATERAHCRRCRWW
ncbi:myosin-binding protein 7-like [Miscanthus floridulus]|uniref:myosin-binding protein 7-like n=1 Tax=Miscanthus floridulus TaxID=154761 RepID=UPI003458E1D8